MDSITARNAVIRKCHNAISAMTLDNAHSVWCIINDSADDMLESEFRDLMTLQQLVKRDLLRKEAV